MWFARKMEAKLRENDHKNHWSGCGFDYLFNRLREETVELDKTYISDGDKADFNEVQKEAADIANFAMMIADNARKSNGKQK